MLGNLTTLYTENLLGKMISIPTLGHLVENPIMDAFRARPQEIATLGSASTTKVPLEPCVKRDGTNCQLQLEHDRF